MRFIHIIASAIIVVALSIGIVCAIPIEPHTQENIGFVCRGDTRLWYMKVDGKGSSFRVFTHSCIRSPSNITVHTEGTYVRSHLLVSCQPDETLCIYIQNVNEQRVDIRYEIEDITVPPNIYIPLFYVAVSVGIAAALFTFISCFGLGIYVGRKAKSKVDIKLIQTDEQTMHYYLAKADNLDPVQNL